LSFFLRDEVCISQSGITLEEYLRGVRRTVPETRFPPDVEKSSGSIAVSAGRKLSEFERQTLALRALRTPDDAEPKPGFYARVMQRIDEARASSSVWSVFLEPLFARRLALASAALVVLLGTFWIPRNPAITAFPPP